MSADEIKRLAEELQPEEGRYSCDIKTLKPVHSALLDYADMVERCEELHSGAYGISDDDYNYILKGATNA